MCILLETRLPEKGLDRAHHYFLASWNLFAIESQVLAGGMTAVWRKGNVNMDVMHDCNQQIVAVISGVNENPWLLCGVYASTNYKLRRVLWKEITRMVDLVLPLLSMEILIILMGHGRRGG